MDSIDCRIINLLRKNAKLPVAELSEKIGISGAAIHKRIKKLENKKIFTGTQFIIDPKKVGFTTLALFVDGFLRMLGMIPPFMHLDVNILDKIEGDMLIKIKNMLK